jgi:hypothetical protein
MVIIVMALVIGVGVCVFACCFYHLKKKKEQMKAEFQPLIDRAREKFMSNERVLDPSIKIYKPMNGTYGVKYTEGGETRSGTTTLYFTDLNYGSGYSISGSSMDADGKARIEEGFVRYDGSDAYWTDQVYEGAYVGLRVLNVGTFDFKSLRFTGTYLSSNGFNGRFTEFKLVGGGDPISHQRSQPMGEFTVIVFKETAHTKVGIKLAVDEDGKIVVRKLSGLFSNTDLKIGDEILEVNGTSIVGTEDISYAISLIRSLSGRVNVIAKRSLASPDSETIVASVFKSSTDTNVGIILRVDVEGKIVVHNLSGLFAATKLQVGDEIVMVNGKPVRGEDNFYAIGIIRDSRGSVTVIARREFDDEIVPPIASRVYDDKVSPSAPYMEAIVVTGES